MASLMDIDKYIDNNGQSGRWMKETIRFFFRIEPIGEEWNQSSTSHACILRSFLGEFGPVLESHTAATRLKWAAMRRGGTPHEGTRRARDRPISCAGGMVCGLHA